VVAGKDIAAARAGLMAVHRRALDILLALHASEFDAIVDDLLEGVLPVGEDPRPNDGPLGPGADESDSIPRAWAS